MKRIELKKVQVHNLQGVDLELPTGKLIVFTGVSGSGKSSLAFDTLYAEGQRRYVESLSAYARRYMGDIGKPQAELISGLSPTISIEQKTAGRNPRSTVGTMTEIFDYLRVLYARVATPHCPVSGEPVQPQSREQIIAAIHDLEGKPPILAPIVKGKKGTLKEELEGLLGQGFLHARLDGQMVRLDEEIELDGSVAHTLDVVVDRAPTGARIDEAVTTALDLGDGVCIAGDQLFSVHSFSPSSGLSYAPLEPQDFSFNHPTGMCPACQGLGITEEFDLDKVIDPDLSIAGDCCLLAGSYETVRWGNIYRNLARMYDFKVTTPWKKLSDEAKHVFLHGIEKKWTKMRFVHPVTKKRWSDYVQWRGILWEAKKRLADATSDSYRTRMRKLMRSAPCTSCKGSRLAPYPAAAQLHGVTLGQLSAMTTADARAFLQGLKLPPQAALIAEELLKEICERLTFLLDVGLHYLTLDRTAPTLSGGEAQRVRLASQIGCGLVGVTYILDEPSIGLHPRDNRKLLESLQRLRDRGNTVIVVEHDEETMRAADHLVDFGPRAGSEGGRIVYTGKFEGLLKQKDSLTGAYLAGREKIPLPKKRKKTKAALELKGASHHNLQAVDLKVPLGLFVTVTGVSGSGKSSLILETLYPALANELQRAEHEVGGYSSIKGMEHLEKVIAIDQSPIGRNPRSNPATYIKLFDLIRDLFTQLPEAKARGYKPGRFSFNVAEGSCTGCGGMGMVKIDMDFLDASWIPCELCGGHRFDVETLSVRFKGKNIYDILEMSVDEALDFFSAQPKILKKLETLASVGLGYITLGQSSTTLSGGEAQRIKLSKELSRPSQGKTLYLLDEPTTGLHFHDIRHLLDVLHRLVDKGNTVLVIEHNLDLIRTADWTIELGPGGGHEGGKIIREGLPQEMVMESSATETAPQRALSHIEIEGAAQNNLKGVDAQIPRGAITCCTGPSGSGKSSFAFETVYAEGQRRYTESLSPYARQFVKQLPKPKVGRVDGLSPAVAIEQKAHAGNPRSTVGTLTEIYDFLRILWAHMGTPHCPETGEMIQAISKEHVVERILTLPEGEKIQVLAPLLEPNFAQLKRQGFLRIRLNGETYELDEEIPYNRRRKNRLYLIVDRLKVGKSRARLFEAIETAAKIGGDQIALLHNEEERPFNLSFAVESTGKSYPPITPRSFAFNNAEGQCPECQGLGCDTCDEERISPLARHVTLRGLSLGKLCQMPCGEILRFVEELEVDERLLGEAHKQLLSRLRFLVEVGLDYLALHRSAPTMSNGEMQRIRLARQLGSGLTGVLYVLDEPTVGLHPHDSHLLNRALKKLKELGNTILMVEHDPLTVQCADHLLTFGPKAGAGGGHIIAQGAPSEIYHPAPIQPPQRRTPTRHLKVKGANTHNLQNFSLEVPLDCFTVVTGVSGSGKSTLVHHHILPAYKGQKIVLDQNPIGHTRRADVNTFAEIAPAIRTLYASLPLAVAKGLNPGAFSYNHIRGMCTTCWGLGHRRIEMHFLPAVKVPCESCRGLRLKPASLEVTYKGKSFGQLLNMTVDQAHEFFSAFPKITRKLNTLRTVGLGYLTLGQRIQTLSGGEAQRLRLSRELAKRTKDKALYLLDEPTTGLSPEDVAQLLNVLQKLVNKGHSLLVVEHNLDLIRSADWVIDLHKGALAAEGPPDTIRNTPTGQFLNEIQPIRV